MFRTIITRCAILRQVTKRPIRYVTVRTLSVQCQRKLGSKSILIINTPKHPVCINFARCYSSYPSHTKVTLPALSPTMEEGTIISWNKKEGDPLNEGDLLAEIETDKATMAFETPEEGFLAKILVPAGTKNIPIGKLICIIVSEESDVKAFADFKDEGGAPAKAAAAPPFVPSAPTPSVQPPPPSPQAPVPQTSVADDGISSGSRVYASPMAKKLAEKRNIRLQGKGTGLYDSITAADLNKLTPEAPSATASAPPPSVPQAAPGAAFVDISVTNIRATIAKRLTLSKQSIPHYYVTVDVNTDKLMAVRERLNKMIGNEGRLSVNDFIIKGMALASLKVPEANSSWLDSVIRQYKNVDVSVAVSTPKGLITPIIFEANNKGILTISKEMKVLATKARENKLQPHEFQGGTISVSNMGMFNVDQFSAIINPPQSCILAVSSSVKRLILDENSEKGFKEASFMKVTLGSDHRVVDGAIAAQWLKAFRGYIEEPETMLL